jgi:hypothetical protein
VHGLNGTPYFARVVSYTCKMLIKLSTGVEFIKLFYSSMTAELNRLECLSLASLIFILAGNFFKRVQHFYSNKIVSFSLTIFQAILTFCKNTLRLAP